MYTDNETWLWRFVENGIYIVDIGLLSVDFFFFSSGCLVAYLYLKHKMNETIVKPIDWRQKLIELIIHIMKRLVR